VSLDRLQLDANFRLSVIDISLSSGFGSRRIYDGLLQSRCFVINVLEDLPQGRFGNGSREHLACLQ
jgi:hypothetical protein